MSEIDKKIGIKPEGIPGSIPEGFEVSQKNPVDRSRVNLEGNYESGLPTEQSEATLTTNETIGSKNSEAGSLGKNHIEESTIEQQKHKVDLERRQELEKLLNGDKKIESSAEASDVMDSLMN